MNQHLADKIQNGRDGSIYASVCKDGRIRLVRLGSYEEVRHRYNQMACLVAGTAMQTLQALKGVGHSRSAPPGAWFDRFTDGNPEVGTPNTLFELASNSPCDRADSVGYLAFNDSWPQNIAELSGMQGMVKSMGEFGRVFYDYLHYPLVPVGSAAEVTAVKRTQDGIKASRRAGYAPFEEDTLLMFLDTLRSARALHFLHEISLAA
jgi:hypothetical protein